VAAFPAWPGGNPSAPFAPGLVGFIGRCAAVTKYGGSMPRLATGANSAAAAARLDPLERGLSTGRKLLRLPPVTTVHLHPPACRALGVVTRLRCPPPGWQRASPSS